ncbi:MAG TPA: peptide chain release factor N(5)-glutamine methyltransferase [Pseudobacteroides sp.]|uniref:peptide chain release factor N(5)-glutamine methyltransferase n=1 Tax=Pseudobacteroides sp. TaxID=1968840 RepID=UPI002F94B618
MQINGNITLKELFDIGITSLKKAANKAPVFEAGVMLCNLLKMDRAFLYSRGDQIISPDVSAKYLECIKRRSEGYPLQYITGHQEFMSLDFKVTEDVLIPRQDTEILVETVIEHAEKTPDKNLRILDIGTGSGCIAISLAYYIKNCLVTALDISPDALETARYNAQANGVKDKIAFVEIDILSNDTNVLKGFCPSEPQIETSHCFDIIVSNPPYIPSIEISLLQKEVRDYEPKNALDGGEDGLDFYREIIKKSSSLLPKGGLLAFETGYNQALAVKALMGEMSSNVTIYNDLSGIARVVAGVRDN